MAAGEEASLKVEGRSLQIRCVGITDSSATIRVSGFNRLHLLRLKNPTPTPR